eukprot:6480230-Amphidinium_carterae.1
MGCELAALPLLAAHAHVVMDENPEYRCNVLDPVTACATYDSKSVTRESNRLCFTGVADLGLPAVLEGNACTGCESFLSVGAANVSPSSHRHNERGVVAYVTLGLSTRNALNCCHRTFGAGMGLTQSSSVMEGGCFLQRSLPEVGPFVLLLAAPCSFRGQEVTPLTALTLNLL